MSGGVPGATAGEDAREAPSPAAWGELGRAEAASGAVPGGVVPHGADEAGPGAVEEPVVPLHGADGDAAAPRAETGRADDGLAAPGEPDGLVAPAGRGAVDALLRGARTQTRWTDEAVSDETLRDLYELLRWGPTSANCSPARFAFLRTHEARERLRPALSAGNLQKTLTAPVVVIVAHDPEFFEQLPRLFPHADARTWFAGSEALAEETAFRNGTLQGAYLLMAARGLGLGTCPMSGFDRERVDEIFFRHSRWRSNFLVALGHGEAEGLYPRSPRLEFDEACVLL